MTNNNSARVAVEEFTIHHEGGDSVVYREHDDFDRTSLDEGALLIRLGIDGLWTIVSADRGQTAPLALLESGIEALTEIRDQLWRMAPEQASDGRCLTLADWGRCHGRHGHDGDHDFPTEDEWRSLNNVPRVVGGAA